MFERFVFNPNSRKIRAVDVVKSRERAYPLTGVEKNHNTTVKSSVDWEETLKQPDIQAFIADCRAGQTKPALWKR